MLFRDSESASAMGEIPRLSWKNATQQFGWIKLTFKKCRGEEAVLLTYVARYSVGSFPYQAVNSGRP